MTAAGDDRDDPARLEKLWSGPFGDDYVERNTSFDHRSDFWTRVTGDLHPASVLEVGCNVGGNLKWIAGNVARTTGVDVNRRALASLHDSAPHVGAALAAARDLPFRNGAFDLVFTMGVLIHQPSASLARVMAEMHRCARRHVLVAEYYSPSTVEVPYRGQEGALFKRDFGSLFLEQFGDLRLIESGFLERDSGWDDITYWILERSLDPAP